MTFATFSYQGGHSGSYKSLPHRMFKCLPQETYLIQNPNLDILPTNRRPFTRPHLLPRHSRHSAHCSSLHLASANPFHFRRVWQSRSYFPCFETKALLAESLSSQLSSAVYLGLFPKLVSGRWGLTLRPGSRTGLPAVKKLDAVEVNSYRVGRALFSSCFKD